MDLTKTYIKMSKKAKEIQERWIPMVGDFIWLGANYIMDEAACRIITSHENALKLRLRPNRSEVWLPKQDQLQAMVVNPKLGIAELLSIALMMNENPDYWYSFDSFEQLWLAIVMYKKYGKVWDNEKEEWVGG